MRAAADTGSPRRYKIPRKLVSTKPRRERALLVGVQIRGRRDGLTLTDSLAELAELARSAGALVVDTVSQKLPKPTHYYLGSGKLEALKERAHGGSIDTVICDDELTPTQQRNLEEALDGVKVIDRTALILDVFARRARTHEGRLQVELAQHEYLLPRLAGQWSHLERLGAGIGTRGPGEAQIETDRRLVRGRIQTIKRQLEDVRRHRRQYRARRREKGLPVATLVGYTNAGKSTLLNRMTQAGVAAEDRLFSTLDPVTRKIVLPSGRDLLLTDTVGFIQKLPTSVVAAFRATLEEIQDSTLILEVVDMSHPNADDQADVVGDVLKELGLADKPRLLLLNKADLLNGSEGQPPDERVQAFTTRGPAAVFTSALTGLGLDRLMRELDGLLDDVVAWQLPVAAGSSW